jgi:hypothetical protein
LLNPTGVKSDASFDALDIVTCSHEEGLWHSLTVCRRRYQKLWRLRCLSQRDCAFVLDPRWFLLLSHTRCRGIEVHFSPLGPTGQPWFGIRGCGRAKGQKGCRSLFDHSQCHPLKIAHALESLLGITGTEQDGSASHQRCVTPDLIVELEGAAKC